MERGARHAWLVKSPRLRTLKACKEFLAPLRRLSQNCPSGGGDLRGFDYSNRHKEPVASAVVAMSTGTLRNRAVPEVLLLLYQAEFRTADRPEAIESTQIQRRAKKQPLGFYVI